MTFYWWSHWFWITTFANVLMLFTMASTVHTYPSQDLTAPYQLSQHSSQTQKPVTKLYQQLNTTQSLETSTTPNSAGEESVTGITRLQSMTERTAILNRREYGSETSTNDNKDTIPLGNFEEQYEEEAGYVPIEPEFISPMEIKRSADDENKIDKDNVTLSTSQINNQTNARNMNTKLESAINNFTNLSNIEYTTLIKRNFSIIESVNATVFKNCTDALTRKVTNNTELGLDSYESHEHNDTECQEQSEPAKLANLSPSLAEDVKLNDEANDSTGAANSISVAIQRVSFTLENVNKVEELRLAENEHRARKSKGLSADYQHASRTLNYPLDSKNLLTRSASIAPNELDGARRKLGDVGNISTEALAIKRSYFLDAGTISAVCLTIFGVCCTIGTAGIVLYRRRYLNKPQTLSEPDSSVYIDDSTMRISDNSDEMYSLDNDSFLNSLEAMTIQNYWTDTVKHTKL